MAGKYKKYGEGATKTKVILKGYIEAYYYRNFLNFNLYILQYAICTY